MKYLLFVCLFCALNATAQTRLKILTYNIFHGENPYKKGQPNLDDIARLINEVKPDLVAFQEVDSTTGRLAGIYKNRINWVQELGKKTKMHGYFGKAMDYDGGGYGEGILTRKPVKPVVTILPNPSGGEPRSLIYAEYPLGTGKKVFFGGTHLCHQYLPNKIAQVEKINQILSQKTDPVIICGDFNFMPGEEPYKLMETHWLDAAEKKGEPAFTFSADNPEIRIDYIWLNKTARWRVTDMQVLPYEYSDHKPVLAIIEIQ
ncbi:MAG: endonuclease/exonuclease/phosphatase family protein [Chitinophagaceae bacterium]|nr:endonuclease/exonuclease/phosphatase family protein [Chitinophagaceae bacterium]